MKKDLLNILHQLSHQLTQSFDDELKEHHIPITADQYKVMAFLWENEGISQQQLANYIQRNRASTGRMVDTLYNKGLVIRKADKQDKRINLLFLTDKGTQIEQQTTTLYESFVKKCFASFSKKEQDSLLKLIKKLKI